MSYHRARTLPSVQPMRNLAEAYGPYAQQVRLVIPPQGTRQPTRANVPGYASRVAGNNWTLGNSGDGLGALVVL